MSDEATGIPSRAPWRACGDDRGGCECGQIWSTADDVVVATVVRENEDHEKSHETWRANVALIASAPDLLAERDTLQSRLSAAEAERDGWESRARQLAHHRDGLQSRLGVGAFYDPISPGEEDPLAPCRPRLEAALAEVARLSRELGEAQAEIPRHCDEVKRYQKLYDEAMTSLFAVQIQLVDNTRAAERYRVALEAIRETHANLPTPLQNDCGVGGVWTEVHQELLRELSYSEHADHICDIIERRFLAPARRALTTTGSGSAAFESHLGPLLDLEAAVLGVECPIHAPAGKACFRKYDGDLGCFVDFICTSRFEALRRATTEGTRG